MGIDKAMLSKLVENLINILDLYHQKRIKNYFKNKNIDKLIDVGSHKGEYLKKMRTNNYKKIYAFEPQPEIYKVLKKNISNFKEVELFNIACDEKNDLRELYINELSLTSSFLKSNEENLWIKFKKFILGKKSLIKKKIMVKTNKLDYVLIKKLKKKDQILLKIDVEGSELSVLKGATKILKTMNVKFIQVENAKNNMYEINNNDKVKLFLKNNGYKLEKSFVYPTFSFSDDIYIKSTS